MKTQDTGFQVEGNVKEALFTLKLHRGEGMTLLAMNWKKGKPPTEFVGFAIEYREPGKDRFNVLQNRITFSETNSKSSKGLHSTLISPIQLFRWIHFPRNAGIGGEFLYRVTPVFMSDKGEYSYGVPQTAIIELWRQTYLQKLNVAFTRGFISSQAFTRKFGTQNPNSILFPPKAKDGLTFKPNYPNSKNLLQWLGFEARYEIMSILDKAFEDKSAQVLMIAYDLNEPEIVSKLIRLKKRLKIIIDNSSKDHGKVDSAETQAANLLTSSAGDNNVKRQHMDNIQHNKIIIVRGKDINAVICGSTNFSWRGLYVQSNNVLTIHGISAVNLFESAFNDYWNYSANGFRGTNSANLQKIQLDGIDVSVTFSPHNAANALLNRVADDIRVNTQSSLFYSLAFLYNTPGPILEAIKTTSKSHFVCGISDKLVKRLQQNVIGGGSRTAYHSSLTDNIPKQFLKESKSGGGQNVHHKFIVIDFDKPTARVYLGSYNFSDSADLKNGEHLLLIRDRRVAVSYAIAALSMFDHYDFRITYNNAKNKRKPLVLQRPPTKKGEKPWWDKFYSRPAKKRDRLMFS